MTVSEIRGHHPILTPKAMGEVDRAAIQSGIDGYRLMLIAGAAISACVLEHYPEATGAIVLCGPGNNGGDGYVAARGLAEAGMPVRLYSSVDPERLKGDAATARDDWQGPIHSLADLDWRDSEIVIDALFGAGLDRPVEGAVAEAMMTVVSSELPVVAADLPSGVSGRTGEVQGVALSAEHTVTFATYKPGHFLVPGADYCGDVHLIDIGIPQREIDAHDQNLWLNTPEIWSDRIPEPKLSGHKYSKGHLGVFSGAFSHTGAARLAAHSALRAGAGLVTVLAPASAIASNAAHLTAIMLRNVSSDEDLDALLQDQRMNGFVLGPGFGVGEKTCGFARTIISTDRALVLDADGLTSFKDNAEDLFSAIADGAAPVILTPHAGEFSRLFPDLAADTELSKVDRARMAADRSGAVVLYKGADTVIAAPDGRAVINVNAPPWLATAGSGDCLAGIIGALLVQHVPAFEAAAIAAYMHGEAGMELGEGLTADDLADGILSPSVLFE
ncbi:NAD(P)H-hydrate dehydratase [Hoeflea poritis]|uniref:Bifunctional NAD(P)H-hydrate repair enzyme n=1 Tax=Hoeflea poritis TaxID=2993659 RepID=A0ABT4VGV4_9HYPH|nr:NAD(P)H-hydrate dehydratase [Hoeflea poritis]MDA4843932.1 NAD(P)H-hydrate dehydratase [Hoeflea poritis]